MPPKICYGNPVTGNDGWSGLTQALAKRTMAGLEAIVAAGDRVSLAAGVYLFSTDYFTFQNGAGALWMPDGSGKVIFDFEGRSGGQQHLRADVATIMVGIEFRNPAAGKFVAKFNGGAMTFLHCVCHQRDGAANTGHGFNTGIYAYECSFYNLYYGIYDSAIARGCYQKDCTGALNAASQDYNAYPGCAETHGIDTDGTNCDPGFMDVTAGDFRLGTANPIALALFRAGGVDGGGVGAAGTPGIFYDRRWPQTRFMVPIPTPGDGCWAAWTNDAAYEDPDGSEYTAPVIEDPTTFEPVLDLATVPDARSGRICSPVFDLSVAGDSHAIDAAIMARYQDLPAGAAVDIDTTLPLEYEYSSDNGTPSWTPAGFGAGITATARYFRERLTLHTNHTNA